MIPPPPRSVSFAEGASGFPPKWMCVIDRLALVTYTWAFCRLGTGGRKSGKLAATSNVRRGFGSPHLGTCYRTYPSCGCSVKMLTTSLSDLGMRSERSRIIRSHTVATPTTDPDSGPYPIDQPGKDCQRDCQQCVCTPCSSPGPVRSSAPVSI